MGCRKIKPTTCLSLGRTVLSGTQISTPLYETQSWVFRVFWKSGREQKRFGDKLFHLAALYAVAAIMLHHTISVLRWSMPTDVYELENTATDDQIGATAFTYKNLIYNLCHLDPFNCNKIWGPANNDNWGKINYVMLFWKAVTNFILPISPGDLSVKVLHLGSVPSGPLSISNPSSPPTLTALFRVLPFFTLPPSDTLWLTDNNKHLENSFKWVWSFFLSCRLHSV